MQNLDLLYTLVYHRSFTNVYIDDNKMLLDDYVIRSRAIRSVLERSEQIAQIFMTYVKALIFEDALNVVKILLSM